MSRELYRRIAISFRAANDTFTAQGITITGEDARLRGRREMYNLLLHSIIAVLELDNENFSREKFLAAIDKEE